MPKDLKVSILISAYNKEKIVLQAVDSALAQDYTNKEIIIAEDQSQDKTWSLLQKYQNRAGIKIFQNQKNLGRVANHRHLLSDLAQGDYVVMLDADDYFLDANFISQAVEMVLLNNLDFVFSQSLVQRPNGSTFKVEFPFLASGVYSWRDIFTNGILFMHGAVFYRRDLALNYNFYSQNVIADDNESFLRFVIGRKVGFLKQSAYLYRQDNNPNRYSLEDRLENDKMIDSVCDFAIKLNPEERQLFDEWQINMRANFFYGNLINLLVHQKFKSTAVYLLRFVKRNGFFGLFRIAIRLFSALRWVYHIS